MPTIKDEKWDVSASNPAVVSGWVFNASNANLVVGTNGGIVQSSPNSLGYNAAGPVKDIIYNTTDSAGGDTVVSTYFYTGNLNLITGETDLVLFNRMTSASPSASATMYQVQLALGGVYGLAAGGVLFGVWGAPPGHFTYLGTHIGYAAFAANSWYQLTLSCIGSTISCRVMEVSTGKYMTAPGGTFSTLTPTDLYSATDTTVTGPGKAGMQMNTDSGSAVFTDNFLWSSVVSSITYTITPPAQIRIGTAGTYTITTSAGVPSNTQITVSELGGLGGTFTQPTLITTGNTGSTFTYTPNGSPGSRTLHFTNNQALVDPSDPTYTVVRAAGTFYVSAAGNDANAGTIGSPWLTVDKVVAQGILTGDTYNFRGGDTFTPTTNLLYDGGGLIGTTPDIITFQSYGTGQAIISITTDALSAFKFTNTGAILVDNLTFTGPNTVVNALGAGVEFWTNSAASPKYDKCTVSNCLITKFRYGVHFWNNNISGGAACTAGYTHPTITHNTIHDCWGKGATVWVEDTLTSVIVFDHVTISYNTIYNIPGNVTQTFDDASAQGITVGKCDTALIERNIVHDVGLNNIDAGAIVTSNAHRLVIQYNELYNVVTAGTDGYGIDIDWSTDLSIVQYNHIHNCVAPGIASFQFNVGSLPNGTAWTNSNNHIRLNIIQNCGTVHFGSIYIRGGYTTDTYVYLNTVYNTAAIANTGVFNFENATDTRFSKYVYFYDNIVVSIGNQHVLYHPASTIAATLKYNVLYTSAAGGTVIYTYLGTDYTSLAAYQTGAGGTLAANNISTNPLLANIATVTTVTNIALLQNILDGVLPLGSVAIAAGINPSDTPYDVDLDPGFQPFTTDYAGRVLPVGSVFDIGAMIYYSSSPPTAGGKRQIVNPGVPSAEASVVG